MASRDRERFVGRTAELAFLKRCLEHDAPANVDPGSTGRGGIGKSTLLRELARRAPAHGFDPVFVEGRELPPMPDALEAVLCGARDSEQPLCPDRHLRTDDRRLTGYLRRGLLPSLPDRAVIVIAGRVAPRIQRGSRGGGKVWRPTSSLGADGPPKRR